MPDVDNSDRVLSSLVGVINEMDDPDFAFGMTFMVPGGMIAGQLVANWRWMELLDQEIRRASQATEATGMGLLFEHAKQVIVEDRDEWRAIQESAAQLPDRYKMAVAEVSPRPGFIHLKDARRVGAQGMVPSNGCLWRGSLQHVAGWALGTLSVDPPSPAY